MHHQQHSYMHFRDPQLAPHSTAFFCTRDKEYMCICLQRQVVLTHPHRSLLVQEAKDREWRARERAAAERQAALMADLAAARKAQMQRQVVARAAMAEVERAEFDRILTVSRERQAAERSQVCHILAGSE
jgi:Trichohyalin-plectin-homology domain